MSRLLRWLLFVPALVAAAFGGWLARELSPPAKVGEAVVFEVRQGDSLKRVAWRLEREGLLRDARVATAWARLRGFAPHLRVGEYALAPTMSPRQIFDEIAFGQVVTYAVAIPEGLTCKEIAVRLQDAGLADAAAFQAVCTDAALAHELGVPAPTLEGYLFPETYRFPHGHPPAEIARAMVEHFFATWRDLAPLAAERGLSLHQVVTLASIVEKETGAPAERPLIASVFANRLAKRMRLESDPTVIYGLADFDGNLRRRDLEDETNPYNTYRIAALPPGPISNPGRAALQAVVEPAQSDYLYFVSRNDGTHVFSRNYRDHLAAVNRHQRKGAGS